MVKWREKQTSCLPVEQEPRFCKGPWGLAGLLIAWVLHFSFMQGGKSCSIPPEHTGPSVILYCHSYKMQVSCLQEAWDV